MLREKKVFALISAAGAGRRMGAAVPKQFLPMGGKTILQQTADRFLKSEVIDGVVIVCSRDCMEFCEKLFSAEIAEKKVFLAPGGIERQDSVAGGIARLREIGAESGDIVLIHDGVRPYVSADLIERVAETAADKGAVIPAFTPKETIRHRREGTLDRNELYAVQTPQGFPLFLIEKALERASAEGFYGTDDAGLVERLGQAVTVIPGESANIKITTPEDLPVENRIGTGFDVHRLTEDRKLILGGVEIPFEKGLLGHSDADVLVHALMDALLGAAAMGDIGKLFPDNDEAYAGISSMKLLARVGEVLAEAGYRLSNADVTVICQKPKLAPYIDTMRQNIAKVLGVDLQRISIKATTTEKLGFTGRGEGIAAEAVCLLQR